MRSSDAFASAGAESRLFEAALDAHRRSALSDAARHYRALLELVPDHAAALNNLGALLERTGDAIEAQRCYRTALRLDPDYLDAHYNLGLLLHEQGRFEEAQACYRNVIALAPTHVAAHVYLAGLLQETDRLADAEPLYRRAVSLSPNDALAQHGLGLFFVASGREEEAEVCLHEALRLAPDFKDANAALAALLHRRQRYAQAEALYRRVLSLDPGSVEALNNLGRLLHDAGRLSEAERYLRQALEAAPGRTPTAFNLGLVLLAMGRYEEGWPLYEMRYGESPYWGDESHCHAPPVLPFPQWGGEPLEGKSLVVFGEQGLGDCVQFARYMPMLKAKGVSKLTLVCPRTLCRLLQTIEGVDACLPDDDVSQLAEHDYACLVMSLPLRIGTTLATVPAEVPYLHVPKAEAKRWKRLVGPGRLSVGLVWAGNPRPDMPSANAVDRRRSLNAAAFAPLLDVPGVAFVSLQKGEAARSQIADIRAALHPCDPMAEVEDFADTAAIISTLDLVITADTSVAHVAGALGKPVWILCRFDGCWRWLSGRDDSPWYPSATLFRQKTPGDWAGVIAEVRAALERQVCARSISSTRFAEVALPNGRDVGSANPGLSRSI
ncbi:tetratricopeptide repeat-containing glycosyltransferase family protein [Trinickia caryophylli]|uniref:Tetratricopeptide (TPR) repeat n=2 Tax=Trinickia caryophylli TaxID=28094 RepID=A0A1X7FNI8_TRICW|nr:Tetratricopeptide (TPR) repeat [Trinickia caryophylli]